VISRKADSGAALVENPGDFDSIGGLPMRQHCGFHNLNEAAARIGRDPEEKPRRSGVCVGHG